MVTTENTNPKKETRQEEMPYSRKAQLVKEILEAYETGFITTVECLSQISTLPWNPLERAGITRILEDSIQFNPDPLKFNLQ